ncbi:hypothetical protein NQ318_020410 [Aromia moschata]|uniref:Phospholipase A2-like domain-containing protein n=1 Tax=Aromia moschata TaxID=1265417 RepID=A0AAV8Y4E3_9CUCU|nr:hypothetical protein NQ318_020410 [Aromia moschata]
MSTVERKGCPRCLYCRGSSKTGSGIANSLFNKLPIELHLPGGYQYCGPGDPGINPLDVACKHHDIAYSQNTDLTARLKADYELEQRAWERVTSNDASIGEKVATFISYEYYERKAVIRIGLPNNNKKKTEEESNKE